MSNSIPNSIQDLTAQFLNQSGRKKKWLAEQLGISSALLSQWFSGRIVFPDWRLDKILSIISANSYPERRD